MADRLQRPLDPGLEGALLDLRRRIAFPPSPDLTGRVRARLAAGPVPRPWRGFAFVPLRTAAMAVVVLLLIIGAVVTLIPGARSAVAEWLGLRDVKVSYAPDLPTAAPAGARLQFGEPLTLDEARARVGFTVRLPGVPDLQQPDEVYVLYPPPGGQVAFVYRPRPGLPETAATGAGLLLTQFRGGLEPGFFGKGVEPGTRLEQVDVDGARGLWIEGGTRAFFYRDPSGNVRDERIRLAGNTLLWERDGITYRLESSLDKDAALRIAMSLR
jgi:hypothetical protein